MSEEEDRSRKDHLKEGRKQLEEETQKFLRQGSQKIDYYRDNRSELIEEFSSKIGETKGPAVSGIIVLTPLFVVFLVVGWLFEKIAIIPGNKYFNIAKYFGLENAARFYVDQTFKLSILLLIAVALTSVVGRLVMTKPGFKLEKMIDRGFDKVPFLGTIYNITKVSTETVFGGTEDLREPVKFEVNGLRLNGFKTGNKTDDGKAIIFVPTSPNITSGFVVELEEDRYEQTDETAEEALTKVLSAGFGSGNNEED